MRVAAHEGLYDTTGDHPVLQGTRCRSCNTVFFPTLSLGCEVCGSTQLEAVPLQPEGVLHSVATVHLYQGHDIEAPFAIGEIQLDAGPLIRGTMAELVEPDAIGARVVARWVTMRIDDAGNDVVEPRFGLV
jgi:uncharacterized OB-fold protein